MSIHQLTVNGITKIEESIALIQAWEPPNGYYLGFSGGKDSVVILDLTKRANVKFDAHYNVSPIDPPEIWQFIKCNYPDILWEKNAKGFWRIFLGQGFPTSQRRWCCRYIKEAGGQDRIKLLGMRRLESIKRKNYTCKMNTSHNQSWLLPIVGWDNNEVWEYIREFNLPYCSLYDEGFTRLGCVLCPYESLDKTNQDLIRFPKTVDLWKRAGQRYFDKRIAKGNPLPFNNFEEYWLWWISRRARTDIRQGVMI